MQVIITKIFLQVNQIKNCFINHAKNKKNYNNKTIKLLYVKFSPFNQVEYKNIRHY